jgi:hypothetical protein
MIVTMRFADTYVTHTRDFKVPDNSTIADLLPLFHAISVSVWDYHRDGPGSFVTEGKIEPDKTYNILSDNVEKTLAVFHKKSV